MIANIIMSQNNPNLEKNRDTKLPIKKTNNRYIPKGEIHEHPRFQERVRTSVGIQHPTAELAACS